MFKINKKQTITIIFIFVCLIGYAFFPAKDTFQYRVVALFFLVLLPFLYNKYFLKKENFIKQIGLGDWRKNLLLLGISLGVSFVIMIFLFKYTELSSHYLLSPLVKTDFGKFLWYELTGVAFTVATYELFFRGFVMNYFVSFWEKWAVLIQFLFFVALMLMLNLPYWFYVTYLIFTPLAGWLNYKNKSMLYAYFGQLFFVILTDATFIALKIK